jgi:hypothetical protein
VIVELYGDQLTHPGSHIDVWDGRQKLCKVPVDVLMSRRPVGGWCSTGRPTNLCFWLTSASSNAIACRQKHEGARHKKEIAPETVSLLR